MLATMTPLEKCLQTLRSLIDVGDVQAIEQAKRAIDEFVASHDGPDRQIAALDILDQEVTSFSQDEPDQLVEILGYIDERVRELNRISRAPPGSSSQ